MCVREGGTERSIQFLHTNGSVYGSSGLWCRAFSAIYEIFYALLKMVMRNEDIKSKSFISRMFGLKDKNTARVVKYSSESAEISDPTMPTAETIKTLRIFAATWNVGGNPPSDDLNLDDFLQIHYPADIYILGFQEIVPLNAGNVLVLEDNEPAAKWLSLINKSLNKPFETIHSLRKTTSLDVKALTSKGSSKLMSTPSGSLFFQKYSLKAVSKQFRTESKKRLKTCNCATEMEIRRYNSKDSCFRCQQSYVSDGDLSSEEEDGPTTSFDISEFTPDTSSSGSSNHVKYGLIVSKQMVGIFLTIWVKKELVQHVSHLRSSFTPRGIMGCLGNKGCISVSLSICQTSFCVICSHLASGEKEGDELRRNLDVIEILKNTQFPRRCRVSNSRVPDKILEHDRVLWLGDLNYRITLSYAETRNLLEKNDWDSLLRNDQLKIEREAGRVFKGWREGKITFAPTYKFSFNSNTYFAETCSSKTKRRTPAWCDRILWHGNGIRQLCYLCKDSKEFQFSDHRPVYATFMVDVVSTETSKKGPSSNYNTKVEIEELLPEPGSIPL